MITIDSDTQPAYVLELKRAAYSFGRFKSALNCSQEREFIRMLVSKNQKLLECTAMSIGDALLQAGSLGLSYNPALSHCYLIPRFDKKSNTKICYASPGYRGLLHLAFADQTILWAKSEVVYEADTYRYRGTQQEPIHEYNMFGDRGKPVGVYVIAKTPDNSFLVDAMSVEQVNAVRDRSEYPNSLMWTSFWSEGAKKAVIRRAQKIWPHQGAKLSTAIHHLNTYEGITYEEQAKTVVSDEQVSELKQIISSLPETRQEKWLSRLARIYGVASIEHLPIDKYESAKSKLTAGIQQSNTTSA